MKCTMQWGDRCDADATHEVRQNHRGTGPDGKVIILKTTYNIAFNCEDHIPKKDAQNYVVVEIK